MRFLILCFLFLVCFNLRGQYIALKDANLKTNEHFQKGQKLAEKREWTKAKNEYLNALNITPNLLDGLMEIAGMYYTLNQFDSTEYYLKQILKIDSKPSVRVLYTLAKIYYNRGDYQLAIDPLERYLNANTTNNKSRSEAVTMLRNARFAINALKHPEDFDPIPLKNINSVHPDYLPSLTADGKTMVFTRMIGKQEDLFISYWEDSAWSIPKPLVNINTDEFNEASQCISADGKTIVFTGCNIPRGFGNCDLYISYFIQGKWSVPLNMGEVINTKGWESQPSLSADGQILYFASERPDGYGRKDIWYSERISHQKWSSPKNLGAPINTPDNEAAPFIHPDGQTIYFMSDGEPGMGGYDLFYSKYLGDKKWTVPTNLGYPINTIGDEGAMVVDLQGNYGYFTSTGDKKKTLSSGFQETNIYRFKLPRHAKPSKVTYFRPVVLDRETLMPLDAECLITSMNLGQTTIFKTSEDGTILKILPYADVYGIQILATGYVFISDKIEIPDSTSEFEPFEKVFLMDKIESAIEKNFVIKNIYFKSGSFELNETSFPELKVFRDFLMSNPKVKIQLNGHTDNIGQESDNLTLSKKRADAVKSYLEQNGINSDRIKTKGYGESKPIESNDTENSRKINRRTEFQIISIEK